MEIKDLDIELLKELFIELYLSLRNNAPRTKRMIEDLDNLEHSNIRFYDFNHIKGIAYKQHYVEIKDYINELRNKKLNKIL